MKLENAIPYFSRAAEYIHPPLGTSGITGFRKRNKKVGRNVANEGSDCLGAITEDDIGFILPDNFKELQYQVRRFLEVGSEYGEVLSATSLKSSRNRRK